MISRIRIALGVALLLTLLTSITAFAKGSFSFITITGPDLKEMVRSTDPALTTDFFAYADFSRSATEAPVDLGVGYEITRYYVDNGRESAFDHLHYYPGIGYVYYDGIVNGSSEYDGKWYAAKPSIKTAFTGALSAILVTEPQPVESVDKIQPNASKGQAQTSPSTVGPQFTLPIVATAGLVVILVLVFRRRRVSAQ